MKFWDSSAIVPLLVAESSTPFLLELFRNDRDMLAWWGTEIECVSALARLERDGGISAAVLDSALRRMRELHAFWHEVQASEIVRETAMRLLRVHPLRAADALQLAAAIAASDRHPGALEFVCLDARLTLAAQREGFNTLTA